MTIHGSCFRSLYDKHVQLVQYDNERTTGYSPNELQKQTNTGKLI